MKTSWNLNVFTVAEMSMASPFLHYQKIFEIMFTKIIACVVIIKNRMMTNI